MLIGRPDDVALLGGPFRRVALAACSVLLGCLLVISACAPAAPITPPTPTTAASEARQRRGAQVPVPGATAVARLGAALSLTGTGASAA